MVVLLSNNLVLLSIRAMSCVPKGFCTVRNLSSFVMGTPLMVEFIPLRFSDIGQNLLCTQCLVLGNSISLEFKYKQQTKTNIRGLRFERFFGGKLLLSKIFMFFFTMSFSCLPTPALFLSTYQQYIKGLLMI